jgi:hypothetical protein
MVSFSFTDGQEFRTQLPVTGFIECSSLPKLSVTSMGLVPVKKLSGKWYFEFHVMKPGLHQLKFTCSNEVKEIEMNFEEQKFLEFDREFGFFFLLFIFCMTGIVIWTRKLMKES